MLKDLDLECAKNLACRVVLQCYRDLCSDNYTDPKVKEREWKRCIYFWGQFLENGDNGFLRADVLERVKYGKNVSRETLERGKR